MSVTTLTRWKGGMREAIVEAARKAKKLHHDNLAESFELSQILAGQHAGEWLIIIRYPSWAAYGRCQEELMKSAEYQKLLAEVSAMATMSARDILFDVDLSEP